VILWRNYFLAKMAYLKFEEIIKEINQKRQFNMPANLFGG